MDIRGLARTLSIFITRILGWLSKNFKKSPIELLSCDTCGKIKPSTEIRQIFGGICICDKCVDYILKLHVSLNTIKMLCPECYDKDGNYRKCKVCNLEYMLDEVSNED
jgi:hypothetical protein